MELSTLDAAIYAYVRELDRLTAATNDRNHIRERYDAACKEVEERLAAMQAARATMLTAFGEETK